jgi:hypothetical protein
MPVGPLSKAMMFVLLVMPGGFVILPALLLLRRVWQRNRRSDAARLSHPPVHVHA